MTELIKCLGKCGTDVEKGKFGNLCRNCWKSQRSKPTASHAVKKEYDAQHWGPGQTMCLFCHEQTKSIRGMKHHYFMTDHLVVYQELSDEEKQIKSKEREEKLANDNFEGAEKTAWF